MAPRLMLPALVQRILLDTSGVGKGTDEAETKLGQFSQTLNKTGRQLSTRLTLPLVGAGVAAVSFAADVDRGLREVVTLFGRTGDAAEETLSNLKTDVADLSNEIGVAQETLVGGLYQAISAGVPEDNAFEFLETAAKAGIAGVTDTETAVDALTTVINAFGLDASQAEDVSDSLFATVAGGKTTFEELSASLFNVAPAAAAAGVDFAEVNAAIATLTASGTPTSVATTQIRAALTGLQRPSAALDAIFRNLGFDSAQLALESEGLGFALTAVANAADGDNGKLTTLLGSVEAVGAANVIAGTGAAKFTEELERQAARAGSTEDAFATLDASTARRFERLKVSVQNLAITFGQILIPVIEVLVGLFTALFESIDSLPPGVQRFITVLAVLAAATGPVLLVTARLIRAYETAAETLPKVVEGVKNLGGELGSTRGRIALQVVSLAALAVVLIEARKRLIELGDEAGERTTADLDRQASSLASLAQAEQLFVDVTTRRNAVAREFNELSRFDPRAFRRRQELQGQIEAADRFRGVLEQQIIGARALGSAFGLSEEAALGFARSFVPVGDEALTAEGILIGYRAQLAEIAGVSPDVAEAAGEISDEYLVQAASLAEAEEAFNSWRRSVAAAFDPVLGVLDANVDLEDAQAAVTEAQRDAIDVANESGFASVEYAEAIDRLEEAQRNELRAAIDQQLAQEQLRLSVETGQTSFDAFNQTLRNFVSTGAISEATAESLRTDIDLLNFSLLATEELDPTIVITVETEVEPLTPQEAATLRQNALLFRNIFDEVLGPLAAGTAGGLDETGSQVIGNAGAVLNRLLGQQGVVLAAGGGLITSPTLLIAGEAGAELLLDADTTSGVLGLAGGAGLPRASFGSVVDPAAAMEQAFRAAAAGGGGGGPGGVGQLIVQVAQPARPTAEQFGRDVAWGTSEALGEVFVETDA